MTKKKGTAYVKMVLSFVLVLCLSLSMVVLFYFYSSDMMEEQVDYANRNLLYTIQSVCDQEFHFYENTLKVYASNEFVEELGEMEALDSSGYKDIETLVEKMRETMFSVSSFDGAGDDILLYFPKIDHIFSQKYGGILITVAYQQQAFSNQPGRMECNQKPEAARVAYSVMSCDYKAQETGMFPGACTATVDML